MKLNEKRVHGRIQVMKEIRLSGPNGVENGIMRDISRGGVGVWVNRVLGSHGDEVEVFVPIPGESDDVVVLCEIVRMVEEDEGYLHGLRYNMIEPKERVKFLRLIETLIRSKPAGRRAHPRLAKRLSIQFQNDEKYTAMLENISLGGIAMRVSEPLILEQELELLIPLREGEEPFLFTGRVIHQIKEGDRYRVGVEFKNLSETAHFAILEVIESIHKA